MADSGSPWNPQGMNFSCVGFDVREWPWNGPFNADETGWNRNQKRYSELAATVGLWQNEYQVLEIDPERLSVVTSMVSSWHDCNLLAVEYPTEIVRLRDSRLGFGKSAAACNLSNFACRGLDVCDLSGLFSVLHHPDIRFSRGHTDPLPTDELSTALGLVQYANVLDPSHAPFVVAKLWSLK